MIVREMVLDWLSGHAYSGLYNEGAGCFCTKEYLGSCGNLSLDCCKAGVRRAYEAGIDSKIFEKAKWIIGPKIEEEDR